MHEEVVDGDDRDREEERKRRDAQKRQWPVEEEGGQIREPWLPQSDSEVVFLTLVMHGVDDPEDIDAVLRAVPPVVQEIRPDERHDPGNDGVVAVANQRELLVGEVVRRYGEDSDEDPDQQLPQETAQVGERVQRVVHPLPLAPREPALEAEDQDVQRDADGVVFRRLHRTLLFTGFSSAMIPG